MSSQPTPSFDDGFSQPCLTLRDHSWLDQERTPDLWEPISSCFEKFILKVRKCCMVLWVVILVPCSKSKQKCPVSKESQEGGALAAGEGGMKDHPTNQADRYWFTWFLRTSHFPHLLSGAHHPPRASYSSVSWETPLYRKPSLMKQAWGALLLISRWTENRRRGFLQFAMTKIRKWQTYQQKFL